jgi:hypothetical protein
MTHYPALAIMKRCFATTDENGVELRYSLSEPLAVEGRAILVKISPAR